MNQPPSRTVFLDVDGVLADWCGAALQLIGIDPNSEPGKKLLLASNPEFEAAFGGRKQLVQFVTEAGRNFWRDLQEYDWAESTHSLISQWCKENKVNLCFLTSPAAWAAPASWGKQIWLRERYPETAVAICHEKHMLAGPTKYLIDDSSSNVSAWINNGGEAFCWPNAQHIKNIGKDYLPAIQNVLTESLAEWLEGLDR